MNRFGAQQAMVYLMQLYLWTNGEQVVLGFEIVMATLKLLDGGFGKSVIRITQVSQSGGNFEITGPRGLRVLS